MKDEIKGKIEAEVSAWEYMKEGPKAWDGFELKLHMAAAGDIYDIYSYENQSRHRKISVYYHDETKEYKLRTAIGLTEFCRIEFIAPGLNALEQILRERFEALLHTMAAFDAETVSCIVQEKQILKWEYVDRLPSELEGFTRFIDPHEPVQVINGSYIIFDYCDFATDSNFIIYYNVFRDEFFGESKICKIPEMNYTFDASELIELEEKLDAYFLPHLKQLRHRIETATGGA